MPATLTGRGAQVILDDTASKAARGAYARTFEANVAYMDNLWRSGVVSDGAKPDGTTRTGGPAEDYFVGSPAPGSVPLQFMARSAITARQSNPRINTVMASPPTVTSSATPTAGLTNAWTISGPFPGVFNYYGGVPTPNGIGFYQFNCVTVNGGYNPATCRIEVVADAAKVMFYIFNAGGAIARFIVNGQYVSLTPTAPATAGIYITLDFTSAGGRAVRSIIMESNFHFQSVSVAPTETVMKPVGAVQRMIVVGDSFASGGGGSNTLIAFPLIMADMLGVRDVWNNGVGGTGYLVASGQTTFRQRLSDLASAAPDIIVIVGGHNDTAFTPGQLQAEVTAYLTAIRSQPALMTAVVVVAGVNGANIPLATTQPLETAIQAAVTAVNDPLVFFVPNVNNAAGPYMTGTGNTAAPTGSGNCDIYIGADMVHPNDAGHTFLARMLANDIARIVFKT